MAHRYVAWPEDGGKTYLYSEPGGATHREVLWGDFLTIDGEENADWYRVLWAPKDPVKRKTLFIPKADTIDTRPLEIIFLDVGQGDGAVLITPEDAGDDERIIVIDAGIATNTAAFLNKRFKAYRGFGFDAAVLTHPDKDHYYGFLEIFKNHQIGFKTIYSSGLIERPVSGKFEKLGESEKDPSNGIVYFHELATSRDDYVEHFSDAATVADFDYATVMHAALQNPKIKKFGMLSTVHGAVEDGSTYMPGFAPSNERGYTIEVLGPVVEPDENGAPRLRKIGDYGETKNGHSVILRLVFDRFSVLFGGDLNEPAEKFLLRHYGKVARFPEMGTAAYRTMIANAAEKFRSEVMKVCHHGSEKVTDAFLEAVNPAAFVISSGDQEVHVHPRPDLLGRLGGFGRGGAPVILSTEVLRSTREGEGDLGERLIKLIDEIGENPTEARKTKAKELVDKLARKNVEVYGAVYVKTDGKRLMTAFRIEGDSLKKRWFYYGYKFLPNGELAREH